MLPNGPVKTATSYRAAGQGRHRMSLFLASQCHEVFGVTQRNSGISVRCSASVAGTSFFLLPFEYIGDDDDDDDDDDAGGSD